MPLPRTHFLEFGVLVQTPVEIVQDLYGKALDYMAQKVKQAHTYHSQGLPATRLDDATCCVEPAMQKGSQVFSSCA